MGSRLFTCLILALVLSATGVSMRAQTGSVEDDAQEFTRLVLKHDRLVLKNNMNRKMSQAELAEMDRLRSQLTAIKAKYGPRGAMRSQATAYDKRVKELSAEVVQPAVRRWVAEEFPEPKVVAASYPDELKCYAAMYVLHGMLQDKAGTPPTPEVTAKLRRYETAWVKINPQSREDYPERLATIEKSMWNKQFQAEVLSRFVPLYAVEAGNVARKIAYDTDVEAAKLKVRSASLMLALVILAIPLLYLMLGERSFHQAMPRNPDEAYPFQLPNSLSTVTVFRKRFGVEFAGGKVTNKSSWTETTTWTSTTPGQVRQSGPWTFKDPDVTHKSSQTVHFYKYTVETPQGISLTKTFRGSPSDVEGDQLFGMVVSGDRVLLYYNFTKANHVFEADGLEKALAMPPGSFFWLAGMAVAAGGSMLINRMFVTGVLAGVSSYENVVGMTIFFTAVLFAIYIAVLRAWVKSMRARKFLNTWLPKFRKFMEDVTPPMERHFGAGDRQRARIEDRLERRREEHLSKNRSET